jgi:hypothetical protein
VRLDLGKGLLDWVQVRTVRWQEQESGAVSLQAFRRPFTLMDREVVEDHHVAFAQRRSELRLNGGVKGRTGDWTIDDPRRAQLMAAQPGHHGHGRRPLLLIDPYLM